MLLKELSHPHFILRHFKAMGKAMVGTWMGFEPYPLAPNEDHRVELVEHVSEGGKGANKNWGGYRVFYLMPKPGSHDFAEYAF